MALSKRDRTALIVCAIVLVIVGALQLILLPALEEREKLFAMEGVKEKAIKEICQMKQEYQDLNRMNLDDQKSLAHRKKDFTLFSHIDFLAQKSGVKDNVVSMQPLSRTAAKANYSVSVVRIKLEALHLGELVNFLHLIETADSAVHIKSISLSKTGKDKKMLEAIIESETFVLKESV